MKKKFYIKYVFIILIIAICTGCNGDVTRSLRGIGYQYNDKVFNCSPFFPKDKDDVNYEKVMFFTASHLINKDGKVYEISLGNEFSSGQNCRVAQTGFSVKAIMDGVVAKGFDNKYYSLTASGSNQTLYSEITNRDNNYQIYYLLLRDDSVLKVTTLDSNAGTYLVLSTDGNIYLYTIKKTNSKDVPPTIGRTSIAYSKNDYGERIVDFNYQGDSSSTYIKLESGKVFRMKATNLSECSKYLDIPCKYELMEDEVLFKYKDRIIAYNGTTVITDYKRYFTLSGK